MKQQHMHTLAHDRTLQSDETKKLLPQWLQDHCTKTGAYPTSVALSGDPVMTSFMVSVKAHQ